MQLPERRFPVESELGRWVREHLRFGEWDNWLDILRVCLPRAPLGLLERRLLPFLERELEASRGLRQLDFLHLISVALTSLNSDVWESLLHNSTDRLPSSASLSASSFPLT